MLAEEASGYVVSLSTNAAKLSGSMIWKSLLAVTKYISDEDYRRKHSGEMTLALLREDEASISVAPISDGSTVSVDDNVENLSPSIDLFKAKMKQRGIDFAIEEVRKRPAMATDPETGNQFHKINQTTGKPEYIVEYNIYYRSKDKDYLNKTLEDVVADKAFENLTKGNIKGTMEVMNSKAEDKNSLLDNTKNIMPKDRGQIDEH